MRKINPLHLLWLGLVVVVALWNSACGPVVAAPEPETAQRAFTIPGRDVSCYVYVIDGKQRVVVCHGAYSVSVTQLK